MGWEYMLVVSRDFISFCQTHEVRKIEPVDGGYDVTLWPRQKSATWLFAVEPDWQAIKAEALAELATPPQFTFVTDPLGCEKMAGLRARPSNPNRKPTPMQMKYLKIFKHPDADKLTFDQACVYLDQRMGRKPKQEEMKITVDEPEENPVVSDL